MDYLPICIDVRGRTCLVVGGGEVALRKVELLVGAGARVRIVAPELCAALRALARRAAITVARRPYAAPDLRDVELVIAATDRTGVNARVAAHARARGVPVNVVDDPALCTFIMPAIVDRSPVLVAVSTAGASPALARLTRARVEAALPPALGQLAAFAARHRDLIKRRIAAPGARRLFWDRVLEGAIADLVLAGREVEAAAELEHALGRAGAKPLATVALLATGDGDPERLSLRAARWLGRAELILHERGVPAAVLALGRRDAERVDVGRLGARGGWSWQKLAREAARRAGPVCVVREGDPYAEGAGRELRLLERAGVRVEVVRPAP